MRQVLDIPQVFAGVREPLCASPVNHPQPVTGWIGGCVDEVLFSDAKAVTAVRVAKSSEHFDGALASSFVV